jgi:hypothetical protein
MAHEKRGVVSKPTLAGKWAILIVTVLMLAASAVALEIPAQLFDIKLELESNVLYDSRNLTAWVTFESFGRVPTPVNYTFIVLDEPGNELYSKTGTVTVNIEKLVTERFQQLSLSPGKYNLILKTTYNTDVTDEFRQPFEVTRLRPHQQNLWSYILWPGVLLVIFLVMIIFFLLRRMHNAGAPK